MPHRHTPCGAHKHKSFPNSQHSAALTNACHDCHSDELRGDVSDLCPPRPHTAAEGHDAPRHHAAHKHAGARQRAHGQAVVACEQGGRQASRGAGGQAVGEGHCRARNWGSRAQLSGCINNCISRAAAAPLNAAATPAHVALTHPPTHPPTRSPAHPPVFTAAMQAERSGAPLPSASSVTPPSLGGRPRSCEIWERMHEK